jgi:predicted nucleic acid-binding protein
VTELLIDASVWLAALDTDDAHHLAAQGILRSAQDGEVALAALDLTLYEVTNVATVRWASLDDAARLLDLIAAACAHRLERADSELLRTAVSIAANHGLTVYDAAYVAAARRHGWTLVSGDADLVKPALAVAPDAALGS